MVGGHEQKLQTIIHNGSQVIISILKLYIALTDSLLSTATTINFFERKFH